MASRPEPTSLTTREGMARALGIEGMSVEQAHQANRQWLEALRNTGDVRVELALANSIWTLQGFPFHASFLERNRQYYDATVRELPFDDAAVTAINDWASDNTRGRIDRIIDALYDFSDMSPHGRRLFISFVRQRTFVEVYEEGTQAAAVTAAGVGIVCAGCGPKYPVVSLTRPFLFAIQDNATQTVLFLGQITDPS